MPDTPPEPSGIKPDLQGVQQGRGGCPQPPSGTRATHAAHARRVPLRATAPTDWWPTHPCASCAFLRPSRHGLSSKLRSLLHRAEHHVADSRHAAWQAGGNPLRAIAAGPALRALRPARAPGVLRRTEAERRDVREFARGRAGVPRPPRTRDAVKSRLRNASKGAPRKGAWFDVGRALRPTFPLRCRA